MVSKIDRSIVTVRSSSILSTITSDADPIVFGPSGNSRLFINHGGGIILKDKTILCLAETVIIPPFMLVELNRYPLPIAGQRTLPAPVMDRVVPMSRTYVNVSTDRGDFEIKANLLAVHPTKNLALLGLQYDEVSDSSTNVMCTCSDPCFDILCGLGLEISDLPINIMDDVTIIGTTSSNFNEGVVDVRSSHIGKVSRTNYNDPAGWNLFSQAQLSISGVYNNSAGSAVLDCDGRLIGIVTSDVTGSLSVNAVAQDPNTSGDGQSFQYGLPHTKLGSGGGHVSMITSTDILLFLKYSRTRDRSISVVDNYTGQFTKVVTPWLGIGYQAFSGINYDNSIDFTGSLSGQPGSYIPNMSGNVMVVSPSIRELKGITVTSVAGASSSNVSHFQAGSAQAGVGPYPLNTSNSPLLFTLSPGDRINKVLSHNSSCSIGSRDGEINPFDVISKSYPGDRIMICYSRKLDVPSYSNNYLAEVILLDQPSWNEYPYGHRYRVPIVILGSIVATAVPVSSTVAGPLTGLLTGFEPTL